MKTDDYAFGQLPERSDEQARLIRQAQLLDPLTERVWRAAGITRGMRVLDLGTGAGDVAMLTARMVGPTGHVVGVERSAEAVLATRERVATLGLANIEVFEGDMSALDLEAGFDAVVGRCILMFVPDPGAVLAHAASFLRPGGVLCVHEIVPRAQVAAPETPLFADWTRVTCAAFQSVGIPVDLGERLLSLYRSAGLTSPELVYERVAGGGEITWWFSDVLAGLLPLIERSGIASAEQLDLDTLAERLAADLEETGGIATLCPMIGAWARR